MDKGDAECRLCVDGGRRDLIPIFDGRLSAKTLEKIQLMTGVQILETDKVSRSICTKCIQVVVKMYQFRKQVQHHNEIIHKKAGIAVPPESKNATTSDSAQNSRNKLSLTKSDRKESPNQGKSDIAKDPIVVNKQAVMVTKPTVHKTSNLVHSSVCSLLSDNPLLKIPMPCLRLNIAPKVYLDKKKTDADAERYLKQQSPEVHQSPRINVVQNVMISPPFERSQKLVPKLVLKRKSEGGDLMVDHKKSKPDPKCSEGGIGESVTSLASKETEGTSEELQPKSLDFSDLVGMGDNSEDAPKQPNTPEKPEANQNSKDINSSELVTETTTENTCSNANDTTPKKAKLQETSDEASAQSPSPIKYIAKKTVPILECTICDQIFYYRRDLTVHQRQQHMRCQFCKLGFKSMEQKTNHLANICPIKIMMHSQPFISLSNILKDSIAVHTYKDALLDYVDNSNNCSGNMLENLMSVTTNDKMKSARKKTAKAPSVLNEITNVPETNSVDKTKPTIPHLPLIEKYESLTQESSTNTETSNLKINLDEPSAEYSKCTDVEFLRGLLQRPEKVSTSTISTQTSLPSNRDIVYKVKDETYYFHNLQKHLDDVLRIPVYLSVGKAKVQFSHTDPPPQPKNKNFWRTQPVMDVVKVPRSYVEAAKSAPEKAPIPLPYASIRSSATRQTSGPDVVKGHSSPNPVVATGQNFRYIPPETSSSETNTGANSIPSSVTRQTAILEPVQVTPKNCYKNPKFQYETSNTSVSQGPVTITSPLSVPKHVVKNPFKVLSVTTSSQGSPTSVPPIQSTAATPVTSTNSPILLNAITSSHSLATPTTTLTTTYDYTFTNTSVSTSPLTTSGYLPTRDNIFTVTPTVTLHYTPTGTNNAEPKGVPFSKPLEKCATTLLQSLISNAVTDQQIRQTNLDSMTGYRVVSLPQAQPQIAPLPVYQGVPLIQAQPPTYQVASFVQPQIGPIVTSQVQPVQSPVSNPYMPTQTVGMQPAAASPALCPPQSSPAPAYVPTSTINVPGIGSLRVVPRPVGYIAPNDPRLLSGVVRNTANPQGYIQQNPPPLPTGHTFPFRPTTHLEQPRRVVRNDTVRAPMMAAAVRVRNLQDLI